VILTYKNRKEYLIAAVFETNLANQLMMRIFERHYQSSNCGSTNNGFVFGESEPW